MPIMAQTTCPTVTTTSRVVFNEPNSAELQVNGTRFVPSNGTLLVPVNPSAATVSNIFVGPTSTVSTTVVSTTATGHWLRSGIYLGTSTGTSTTVQSGVCINGANYFVYNTGQAVNVQAFQDYKPWIKPQIEKKTKSSIKRALKLMANVGFEEEARIFLKGDTVEVSHPESLLKFVIKKAHHSILDRTVRPGYSTPYALSLYTKSDVHVANLCVYMENTPMLDQVLAVAMFIKSGSEEMILKQANWFRLNADRELRDILALEYPYLSRKLQSRY